MRLNGLVSCHDEDDEERVRVSLSLFCSLSASSCCDHKETETNTFNKVILLQTGGKRQSPEIKLQMQRHPESGSC